MKKNGKLKRALSVLLTLVMAFGNIGLFAGLLQDPADAATAGRYNVHAYVAVNDTMDNCNLTATLYGRANNGTASSETNMGSFTWNDEDLPENYTENIFNGQSDAGVFPTRINLHLDSTKYYFDRTVKLYIHLLIQGEEFYMQATINSFKADEYSVESGGPATFYWKTADILWGKENYFDVDYKIQSSDYPHTARITSPTGPNPVNIPRTGASNTTANYTATVKDQYGVNWYQNPTFKINENMPTSASTVSSNAAPTGCSMSAGSLTVSSNAQIAGNQNAKTVYVSAYCGNAWVTKPITLNDPKYTLTYKKYDGTVGPEGLKTEQVAYGDNGERSEPITARTGYTFLGWSTSVNQSAGQLPKMNVTSDLTLYEAWAPNTYSVGFDKGSGSGTMSAQSFNYDEAKPLSENSYIRRAYLTLNRNYGGSENTKLAADFDFDGWTGEDLIYETATYSATASGGYTTVKQYSVPAPYGGFKEGDRYVFEFDAKGSGDLTAFFYGESGYKRIASAVCSNGQTSTSSDGNMTIALTSDFQRYTVTYTIGADGDGSKTKYLLLRAQDGCSATVNRVRAYRIYADQEEFYFQKDWNYTMTARWTNPDPIELPSATREFFTFGGWYEKAACTDSDFFGNAGDMVSISANKVIYAKWIPVSFDLTYVEGLEGENETTIEYKYNTGNQAMRLKRPTGEDLPDGYDFVGWKVTATEGNWVLNETYPGGMTTKNAHGNVTLRAQYQIRTYNAAVSIGEGGSVSGLPEGATLGADGKYHFTVTHGDSFAFNVSLETGYDTTTPDVYRQNCNYELTGSGASYTVTITDVSGEVAVRVTPKPKQYSVSVDCGEGVTLDEENSVLGVDYNETASFTVMLQEGYSDLTAKLGEAVLTPAAVSGANYYFEIPNVRQPLTVTVTATHITCSVAFTVSDGASTDPSETQTLFYGEDLSFTVTLSEGYTDTAPAVTVNGDALSPESSSGNEYTYTLTGVTEDLEVNVTAALNEYSVTVNTDAGLEPVAGSTVAHGGSYTLVLTLKEGYEGTAPRARVGAAPIALTEQSDGTFTGVVENVTGDLVIDAFSTLNTYLVTISGDEGAELSDTAFDNVSHGATVSFTVTLKEHYTNTAPVVTAGDETVYPVEIDGAAYTYEVTITSDTQITVETAYNSYLISFVLPESAQLIWSARFNEGVTPAYGGEHIDTVWDSNKHYVFTNEWTPEFVPATADATYVAVVDGNDHEWTDTAVITEAKCFTDGEKSQSCGVCGATRNVPIDAIGHHTWNDGTVTTEPTCTEDGVKTYTCAVCGDTRTEPVNKLNHNYGAWVSLGEGENDSHTRTCANDPAHVETAPHRWNEGTVNEGYSCVTGGIRTYTCLDCGQIRTETIAPGASHTWGDWETVKLGNEDHYKLERRTCVECGAIQERSTPYTEGEPEDPNTTHEMNRLTFWDWILGIFHRIVALFDKIKGAF